MSTGFNTNKKNITKNGSDLEEDITNMIDKLLKDDNDSDEKKENKKISPNVFDSPNHIKKKPSEVTTPIICINEVPYEETKPARKGSRNLLGSNLNKSNQMKPHRKDFKKLNSLNVPSLRDLRSLQVMYNLKPTNFREDMEKISDVNENRNCEGVNNANDANNANNANNGNNGNNDIYITTPKSTVSTSAIHTSGSSQW